MQTRRQVDLHTVSIQQLSSNLASVARRKTSPQKTRVRRREAIIAKIQQSQEQQAEEETVQQPNVRIERIPAPVPDQKDMIIDKYQSIIHEQSCLIVEQRGVIQTMHDTLQMLSNLTLGSQQQQREREQPQIERFMLIDTESFKFDNDLLPLQIGCGVYEWDEHEMCLKNIADYSVYVEQIYYNQHFRDAIPAGCMQKHDENITLNNYMVSDANLILGTIRELIETYRVSTLVGYNISWDFLAIGNLASTFCKDIDGFDPRCDNPFNPMELDYLDLMHEIVKKYGRELAAQGIHDGTVHRADDSNRIVLRRDTKFSKSIYSAEYVLHHFFGVSQHHMANTDVTDEALILEKCLADYGPSSLEYNISYPQMNCYQRMLHHANEMFVDPIDVNTETDDEEEDEDSSSLEEGEYRPPKKNRLVKKVMHRHTPSPEVAVCLFDEDDGEEEKN
jgi:hypothetical protein